MIRAQNPRVIIGPIRAVSESAHIAVTSSRGDGDGPGGLASWQIDWLSDDRLSPPVLMHTHPEHTGPGFEQIVYRDNILFAAKKPNSVVVFHVNPATGAFQELAEVILPEVATVFGLGLDGTRLYVSDSGVQHPHEDGQVHFHLGGGFTVLDVSEPFNPIVVGSVGTEGPARDLTLLGDKVVAVARGSAGIELIDVLDSAFPVRIGGAPTHGTAVALDFDDGFLLASHWNYLALYDASARGVLRLLDSSDGLETPIEGLKAPFDWLVSQMFQSSTFVGLQDGLVYISDFDSMRLGQIHPGRVGPRLIAHQRRIGVSGGSLASQDVVTFHNGGRIGLWVELEPVAKARSETGVVALTSGEVGLIDIAVTDVYDHLDVVLRSNDQASDSRKIRLMPSEQKFQLGDPAPDYQILAVTGCDDPENCPAPGTCVDMGTEVRKGRPVVLAFFSFW
ncbi:MAG: hypothetical protein ACI9OJ_000122 [Myxococcota bacterium]|jgi:hypothetical protein